MNAILEFIIKAENAPFLLGALGSFAFLWLNRELKIIQEKDLKPIKKNLENHITDTDKKIDKLVSDVNDIKVLIVKSLAQKDVLASKKLDT